MPEDLSGFQNLTGLGSKPDRSGPQTHQVWVQNLTGLGPKP